MSEVILEATGLVKSFLKQNETIEIVKGVDFTLQQKEMVAITGASGVGKSTFLHLLGTLEKPDAGTILYGPQKQNILNLTSHGIAQFRNRALGFIFQFHHLLPEFSALENVMLPALISGLSKEEARVKAQDLLSFVGLTHRLDHRPAEMSGGEQQRVAIARAVVMEPKIILADEPTGNLDSKNSDHLFDLLTQLNQEKGVSVVLVTHDLSLSKKMHRILQMKDGVFVD